MIKKILCFKSIILFSTILIVSCSKESNNNEIWDPLEPINRQVFSINMLLDTYALKPLSLGYNYITPNIVKTSINNHINWSKTPSSIVNSSLQLKTNQTFSELFVFSINALSFGFYELIENDGISYETFDDTLAHYNIPTGPYLVIPLLGPSTSRGISSQSINYFINPSNLIDDENFSNYNIKITPLDILDNRSRYMDDIDNLKNNSFDPYSKFRSIYFQQLKKNSSNDFQQDSFFNEYE